MIVRLAERPLRTRFGTFNQILYYDGQKELIALVMGEVAGGEGILCRVHSQCISGHVFNSVECDCRGQMEASQRLIQERGCGIVIWLDQEGRGNGHFALMKSRALKDQGLSQSEAYVRLGFAGDARRYVRAAEVLRDLSVESITLLTDSGGKADQLAEDGIRIAGVQPLGG